MRAKEKSYDPTAAFLPCFFGGRMRKLINLDHAFFAQPIRRYVTVAVCIGWGLFELYLGSLMWFGIFVALGGVALWQFRQIDWSKYDGGH